MHHLHYGLLGSNSERKAQGGLDTYIECSVFFLGFLVLKNLELYIYILYNIHTYYWLVVKQQPL